VIGPAARATLLRALGFALVLEAMLVPALLFWPNFRQHMDSIRQMAGFIPVLQKLTEEVTQGGVAAYVVGQHFFKGCNTLGIAAAVLFANGAVAGEAQRGTLEIWLARPLSRKRILTERWLSGALAVALPIFATTATIPLLLHQVQEDLAFRPLLLCAAQESALLLAIYSLTFLCSSVGRSPGGIAFGVLFLMIFQFAVYLVERVTHASLFRLTDVPRFMAIFEGGSLELRFFLPLVASSAVCLGLSLYAFERRVP
jgi:ABC-type transport system involved in multi-copper enzyme maturation permease subunit